MANMCENVLRVTGPADDVKRFKEQASGFSPWLQPRPDQIPEALNFHSLVPIPADVRQAGFAAAGRDWEIQNWGCKWGACDSQIADDWDEGLIYEFETAWSPALAFIQQVSRDWPTLQLVLEYKELSDGYQGLAKAEAGKLEDHCIRL